MDLEPYLITSAVRGIMAQRLVRKICTHCREAYTPVSSLNAQFGYTLPNKIYRGAGCTHCNNTGYDGRVPIFELLIPDETISQMVMHRASASEIRMYAVENGLVETLRFHGLKLIKDGITSVEEVMMKTEKDELAVQFIESEINHI